MENYSKPMYPHLITTEPHTSADIHTPSDPPPSYDIAVSNDPHEPSAPPQSPSSMQPYQPQSYPQQYPLPLPKQPQYQPQIPPQPQPPSLPHPQLQQPTVVPIRAHNNPPIIVASQINTASHVIVDQPVPFKVGPQPCRVTCPGCGTNKMTRVNRNANSRTHIAAFVLCLVGWCCCACCVPYCMSSCKTTNHHCKKCNKYLGSYDRRSCK